MNNASRGFSLHAPGPPGSAPTNPHRPAPIPTVVAAAIARTEMQLSKLTLVGLAAVVVARREFTNSHSRAGSGRVSSLDPCPTTEGTFAAPKLCRGSICVPRAFAMAVSGSASTLPATTLLGYRVECGRRTEPSQRRLHARDRTRCRDRMLRAAAADAFLVSARIRDTSPPCVTSDRRRWTKRDVRQRGLRRRVPRPAVPVVRPAADCRAAERPLCICKRHARRSGRAVVRRLCSAHASRI